MMIDQQLVGAVEATTDKGKQNQRESDEAVTLRATLEAPPSQESFSRKRVSGSLLEILNVHLF